MLPGCVEKCQVLQRDGAWWSIDRTVVIYEYLGYYIS